MAVDLGELLKDVPKLDTGREQIEYIPLDRIDEDQNNFYRLSGIDELAANIQLCGLQQPIRVRPNEGTDRFVIVSGHRRRKAVEMLAQEDPERWAEVACIVERDAVSPALQQLRLIYANANTRTMTSAEISEQAVQVEKLLYQLKEDGYEFPGRMRDHVAQAVGASKSKLARLKMIRDNLAEPWLPSWKSGDLSENTAYELAKLREPLQTLLFEEKSRTKAAIKYICADDIKKFSERCEQIEQKDCQLFDWPCANTENKKRKAAVAERWGWFHCSEKCCNDCPELIRCSRACPKLAEKVRQMKADAKADAKAAAAAQAEKDRPVIEKISAIWQRFGYARELAGKEIDDCRKILTHFLSGTDEVMKLECGEAKITTSTKLPFLYYASEADRLISLADLLECSLDFLFCRTEIREVAQEGTSVPNSGTETPQESVPASCRWYPASVEPPVGKPLVILDYHDFTDDGVYMGGGIYTGRIDEGDPVRAWSLKPSDEDLSGVAAPDTGWRTGTPEAYGTYAAYVQIAGSSKNVLRELLWDGKQWLIFGNPIDENVQVICWAPRPLEF